jgi:hypothetical protein
MLNGKRVASQRGGSNVATIPVFGGEDRVPGSVAGLNLIDVIRYEDPRMGAEFRYGFPPICKADAYLYDMGLTGIPEDLRAQPVLEAFRQSYDGVMQTARIGITRDLEELGTSILTLPDEPSTPFCYYASFAYRQNEQPPHVPRGLIADEDREYVASDIGRVRSHLAVRADRGFINKIRFTYVERATEPSYLGIDPAELPEHLRNDVAFAGFWNFLLAWTRAVQSAPTLMASQPAGSSPPSAAPFFGSNPGLSTASTDEPQPSRPAAEPGSGSSAAPPPNANICQACHRAPAAPIKLTQQTGMVFTRRSGTINAVLCQSCGTAMFRQAQSHNLASGWWGIVSFFANFFYLGGNAFRSMKHRLIGPPAGPPLAPAPDPGRPVWLRWQIIVPVVLAVLAIIVIVSATGHQNVGTLRVGQCINVPTAGKFSDVTLVPCEEPHDAEVAGVLPGSTPSSVDIDEACIQLAAENVLLSKARSVAPGTLVRAPMTEQTGTSDRVKSNSEKPLAICILAGLDGAKLTGRVTGGDGAR